MENAPDFIRVKNQQLVEEAGLFHDHRRTLLVTGHQLINRFQNAQLESLKIPTEEAERRFRNFGFGIGSFQALFAFVVELLGVEPSPFFPDFQVEHFGDFDQNLKDLQFFDDVLSLFGRQGQFGLGFQEGTNSPQGVQHFLSVKHHQMVVLFYFLNRKPDRLRPFVHDEADLFDELVPLLQDSLNLKQLLDGL